MKYTSNAKYNEPVESGTIFETTNGTIDICVHKYVGCGDTLYLSSNAVGIRNRKLKSEKIINAIHEAEIIVKEKVKMMEKDIEEICNSNVEISRY